LLAVAFEGVEETGEYAQLIEKGFWDRCCGRLLLDALVLGVGVVDCPNKKVEVGFVGFDGFGPAVFAGDLRDGTNLTHCAGLGGSKWLEGLCLSVVKFAVNWEGKGR
jgi:hypothetical protein